MSLGSGILCVQDSTLYTQNHATVGVVDALSTAETSSCCDEGPGTARSSPTTADPEEPLARDQARSRGLRAQPLGLDRPHAERGHRQARPQAAVTPTPPPVDHRIPALRWLARRARGAGK